MKVLHFVPLIRGFVLDMAFIRSLLQRIVLPLTANVNGALVCYVSDKVVFIRKEIGKTFRHKIDSRVHQVGLFNGVVCYVLSAVLGQEVLQCFNL